ncbi:hypothetical protein CASFOL_038379 [Castilleja foliolosa]|uniref:F-box domain-containing protein n=1 Tax=Castilleja foliolosa TaxID=1961234 RepID=A0ABD3BKT9_9LAMI
MAKLKLSSAQIVASIDDLLIKIIQPLPLKSIFQLRLVSKYWNSLLLDPNLCLLRNRPVIGLIFEELETTDYPALNTTDVCSYIISLDKSIISPPIRKMIPRDTWYQHCKILHSCNGLLLCVSNPATGLSLKYYVCNPTTKKYITLPKVVLDHNRVSIHGMYLAFDPNKSLHYKVICLLRSSRDWLHLFDVYSSETGTWRKGGKLFKAVDFDFEDGVVYWNGAIHWVNIVTKTQKSVYFSLDCDDQTLKVFPNPPLLDKQYCKSDYYFGESCDHLHFVDSCRELDDIIVYEMKKDYSEWFVKYKVSFAEIQRDYTEWDPYSEGLMKHKVEVPGKQPVYKYKLDARIYTVVRVKNDEDSSFLVMKNRTRIARYNFKQKNCETLCDLKSVVGDRWFYWGSKLPFQCIESICSV